MADQDSPDLGFVVDYPEYIDSPLVTDLEEGDIYVNNGELVIVNWNIERGVALKLIIEELKELNPDIILLQEVDVGRRKTKNKDIAKEIASALRLRYVAFGTEFKNSKNNGLHGNAILSRFAINEPYIVRLPTYYLWKGRQGARMGLVATIDTGELWGKFLCVSLHLENNCSPVQRRTQFRTLVDKVMEDKIVAADTKIIIGGDMNTLVTGWARFYDPKGQIWERLTTVGKSEARLWEETMPDLVGKNGLFQDPFDPDVDVTFKYKKHLQLYSAKLDWLLFHNFPKPTVHKIGGITEGERGVRSSDHSWLVVNIPMSQPPANE